MKKLLLLLIFPLLLSAQITTLPGGGSFASGDADADIQDISPIKCTDAGASDAYTCTMSPVPSTCADAPLLWFDPNTNNTGAATLDCGPGGALPIYQGRDGIDPDDSDLLANVPILLRYCAACNTSAGAWLYEGLGGVNKSIVVSTACAANSIPQLDGSGKLTNACLPTATSELIWIVPEALIVVGDTWPLHLPNYQAGTVTAVFCIAKGAGSQTVDVNFDARDRTIPGTPGTDLETAEFQADSNGISDTSFAGDTVIAENEDLWMTISAKANTPTELRCSVSARAN